MKYQAPRRRIGGESVCLIRSSYGVYYFIHDAVDDGGGEADDGDADEDEDDVCDGVEDDVA